MMEGDKNNLEKSYPYEILWLLAMGEKEIESGEGHDLDSILAEADSFLAKKSE